MAAAMLSTACGNSGKCSVDTDCSKGLSCCDGACVDAQSDRSNCGHCGVMCGTQNAAAECSTGLCRLTCASGFGDCNGSALDGCETKLSTSPSNCGACGNSCAAPHSQGVCINSTCASGACEMGFKDCNASRADGCETAVSSSSTDCGDCGKICQPQHASGMCTDGSCQIGACASGFDNCNGNPGDGCETDLSSDPNHCGDCATACDANLKCINSHCSAGSLLFYGGLVDLNSPVAVVDVTSYDTVSHAYTTLNTTGNSPGGRYGHLGVWDAAANRLVVWGGFNAAGAANAEVYALDFNQPVPTWSTLSVTGSGPASRGFMSFGFDAAHRVVYLSGGTDMNMNSYADSWALDLVALSWTEVSPSAPPARAFGLGAFEGGRFVVGLGADPMSSTALTDFDAYPPDGGWSMLSASGASPGGRAGLVAFGDAAPLTFFGGYDPMTGMADTQVFVADESDGGFALNATPYTPSPGARAYCAGTAAGGRRYVFGGYNFDTGSPFYDLWSFDPDGGWQLENPGDAGLVDGGYDLDAGYPVPWHSGTALPTMVGR